MGEKIILAVVLVLIGAVTIEDMVNNGYSNTQMFYLVSAVVLVGYLWFRKKPKQKG